jgi:hypothetical protein
MSSPCSAASVVPPPPSDDLRLTPGSYDVVERWSEEASDTDRESLEAFLEALLAGTWAMDYSSREDVTRRGRVFVQIRPGLWVLVRFIREYPNWVQLVSISEGPVVS